MTLVPIIYTSLLIFSAILVFVILVSYISFRARSTGKKPVAAYAVKHTMVVRPAISQGYHNPAPIMIPAEKASRPVYLEPSPNQKKQIVLNIDRTQLERQHSFENSQGRRVSQNRPRVTREDRIAIMNETNQFRVSNYGSHVAVEKSQQKLPDMNLLNYYSDRSDSEFISLTA
ncbi:MAG: hypothetical protein WCZ90_14035 [Melioribacteraceae bacterium]